MNKRHILNTGIIIVVLAVVISGIWIYTIANRRLAAVEDACQLADQTVAVVMKWNEDCRNTPTFFPTEDTSIFSHRDLFQDIMSRGAASIILIRDVVSRQKNLAGQIDRTSHELDSALRAASRFPTTIVAGERCRRSLAKAKKQKARMNGLAEAMGSKSQAARMFPLIENMVGYLINSDELMTGDELNAYVASKDWAHISSRCRMDLPKLQAYARDAHQLDDELDEIGAYTMRAYSTYAEAELAMNKSLTMAADAARRGDKVAANQQWKRFFSATHNRFEAEQHMTAYLAQLSGWQNSLYDVIRWQNSRH